MAKIPEPNVLHQFNGRQIWESPPGSCLMFNGEGLSLGLYVLNNDGSYDPVPLPVETPVDQELPDVEAVEEPHHSEE